MHTRRVEDGTPKRARKNYRKPDTDSANTATTRRESLVRPYEHARTRETPKTMISTREVRRCNWCSRQCIGDRLDRHPPVNRSSACPHRSGSNRLRLSLSERALAPCPGRVVAIRVSVALCLVATHDSVAIGVIVSRAQTRRFITRSRFRIDTGTALGL